MAIPRRFAFAPLMVVTIAAMFDASCSSKSSTTTSTLAPPIVIGVSLGLTGGVSSFSLPLQNAVKVAEIQINSVGGLLGHPVHFEIQDDQSDETTMQDQGALITRVANSLIADGAVAFLGPSGSGQVLTIDQLLYNDQIIQITPSATSIDLTAAQPSMNRYLFRTAPPDSLQGRAVVDIALQGPTAFADGLATGTPCKRMAIVHMDNSYGTGLDSVVAAYFPTKGGTIVEDITVPTAVQGSYATQVAQVTAAMPDCQALFAYDDVGDQYMADLTTAKTNSPSSFSAGFFVIGTDGLHTSGFLENGRTDKSNPDSPTVAEGVIGTDVDTTPATSDYNDFRNLYAAQFPLADGENTPHFTANMYDAAILAALAIAQAGGTTDKVKIRDSLFAVSSGGTSFGPAHLGEALLAIENGMDIDYTGASGNCDFDENGNVITNYIVWTVKDGAFDDTAGVIKATDLE